MKFNMQTRCKPCKGTGLVGSSINTEDIFNIVLQNLHEEGVNKISAIKQVRDECGIGLKEAKELVEGAMAFYTAIQKHTSDSELSQCEENGVDLLNNLERYFKENGVDLLKYLGTTHGELAEIDKGTSL